jgi:hypothetical protein
MSDVMNKVTFQTLKSVHTPDYPKEQWWNTFDNPTPELPEGFDYNPRNWKTVEDKIVETTEEEKGKWDDEHPIPEPVPTVEERLALVESALNVVKDDVETLKTTKEPTK